MADKQYDVPEKVLKLFKIKQEQRKSAKEYYQKLLCNPYRPLNGVPFDPVVHRFVTLHSYQTEHYRPNPRNMFYTFLLLYFPIFVAYKVFNWECESLDKKCRSGLIAYKDRNFKEVL